MELEAEVEKLKKENKDLLRKQVTKDVITHQISTFASQRLSHDDLFCVRQAEMSKMQTKPVIYLSHTLIFSA